MTTENDDLANNEQEESVDLELLAGMDEETPEQTEEKPEETSTNDEQEADPEEEPAEEAPANKRDSVIPRARFDEVNARLHAERAESERLRAELAARQTESKPTSADINDLEDQYYEAFMSGEKEQAIAIRKQINAQIYAESESAAERKIQEREAATSFNQAVTKATADYPFLDPSKDVADAQAIADVVEWRDFYISRGSSPAEAITQAVSKIAPMYAKQPAASTTNNRQQQAIQRGAKDAVAQPPKLDAGVGNRAIPAGDAIIDDLEKWGAASKEERMRHLA